MRTFAISHSILGNIHPSRHNGASMVAHLPYRCLLVVLLAMSLIPLGAAPASAYAVVLRCGDTIRHDTTLHRDLRNCPGDGLVVGANGITLNLNGHVISGSTTAGTAGVRNADHPWVTVVNGSVHGFDIGVDIRRAHRVTLRKLDLTDQVSLAVLLLRADHNMVQRSSISHPDGNGAGEGILLFRADANVVARNSLHGNSDGITVDQSSGNLVRNNVSSDGGTGIGLFDNSYRNVISSNEVNNDADTGILLDRHADANRIERNFASGNGFAGIAVGASDRNIVRANMTDGNFGSGITALDNAAGTIVEYNRATDNGDAPPGCVPDCPLLDDGIHVDAPDTTLTRNTSNHNADLGIAAVPGVTDGGGNIARRNGDPLQCTGVACAAHRSHTSAGLTRRTP